MFWFYSRWRKSWGLFLVVKATICRVAGPGAMVPPFLNIFHASCFACLKKLVAFEHIMPDVCC